MNDSTARFQRPDFACTDTPHRTTMAFLAFLASSALLGGLLGLFEMQSNAAAMARAAAPAKVAASASAPRPAAAALEWLEPQGCASARLAQRTQADVRRQNLCRMPAS